MTYKGKLSLVGAGPGDPELITLKGIKALKTAGAVLYDALANPDLLDYAPAEVPKIYVGKRANNHRFTQQEINQMVVSYALSHGHVVRLKGGDPFVFGRGHEEKVYAEIFDIEVDVIPGISSSLSLAALQGVPLTRRGMNESFWVLTGTTKSGKLSQDIPIAAQSSATAIILMGMRKIDEIVWQFQQTGKGDTPVMIIQNGSLPNEHVVLGTVNTIGNIARETGIGSPAIIVIGEVVHLHPHMAYEYVLEYSREEKTGIK